MATAYQVTPQRLVVIKQLPRLLFAVGGLCERALRVMLELLSFAAKEVNRQS